MGRFIPVLVALLVGVAQAAQGPINSELSRHVGQMRAVFISIMVSVTTIVLIVLLRPGPGAFASAAAAPRWAFFGGFMGIISLIGAIIAVPRIGVAATTGSVVAAQILVSALIDRYGLLGVAVRPLSPGKLAGLALLVVAVGLVTRG